jgi:FHA domain-containing protein
MPNLRDFERRLGGLVEGLFSKTFRSGVQPVELAKRLIKEMDAGRTIGVNEVWAPNRFVFSLSAEDHERLAHAESAIASELGAVTLENASERGWGLVGPPEIEFVVDDQLSKGRFEVETSFVEGEEELAPLGGGQATLTLYEGGKPSRTFALANPVMTLGRLPETDITVPDAGASRQHARISNANGEFVLTDLGSTNGTLVNDEVVQEQVLQDGDRITIGETVLEFRRA